MSVFFVKAVEGMVCKLHDRAGIALAMLAILDISDVLKLHHVVVLEVCEQSPQKSIHHNEFSPSDGLLRCQQETQRKSTPVKCKSLFSRQNETIHIGVKTLSRNEVARNLEKWPPTRFSNALSTRSASGLVSYQLNDNWSRFGACRKMMSVIFEALSHWVGKALKRMLDVA